MKSIPSLFARFTLPAIIAAAFLATSVKADTYIWDADADATIGTPAKVTPGSGTWNASGATWNLSGTTATDVVWTNSATDTAKFGATTAADGTYAITVDASVTNVGKLNFLTSGFTLSSTAPTTVALAGGSGGITVAGGQDGDHRE